jgi:hypothetical protein
VADAVWVEKSPAGHASFSGLLRCDSPWACPACAARLAAERAAELSRVVEEHGKDRAAMLTASLAHAKADDLKTLRTGMAAALKYVRTHREWRALAERYVLADARALEVQRGGFAGWHPHYHLLLLLAFPRFRGHPDWREYVRRSDPWRSGSDVRLQISSRRMR